MKFFNFEFEERSGAELQFFPKNKTVDNLIKIILSIHLVSQFVTALQLVRDSSLTIVEISKFNCSCTLRNYLEICHNKVVTIKQ